MDSNEQDVQPARSLSPSVPMHQLKTPPMIDEAREEIFPRMYNERYTITLPGGVQMREMYDRWQEKSLLFLMK